MGICGSRCLRLAVDGTQEAKHVIESRKSPAFEAIFRMYNQHYLIRRAFRSVTVEGFIDPPDRQPAVYVMNHSSWWDGLLVYAAVTRHSQRSHYMMMEERQLARYRFFRRIGAFSIDKSSTAGIRASFLYAGSLLKEGHSVWLYPQGEIAHLERRPLGFRSGAGLLLQLVPTAAAVPVTLYVKFGFHQKPEAALRFGEPILRDWRAAGRAEIARELEEAVTTQLDRMRQESIDDPYDGLTAGRALFPTGSSVQDVFDKCAAASRRLVEWRPFSGS
jgi:1-acyl-sn-glycerol-3-phosphate acyltransferase